MTNNTYKILPRKYLDNWFNWLGLLILCAFFGVSFWSAHAVFVLGNTTVYAENGPIESLQAILLATSCIVFLLPVVLNREPGKLIPLFLALLCYSFLVRELDVERLNVPDFVKFIGSGIGRNTTLAVGFISLLTYAGTRFSYYKNASIQFLKSRPGILLMLGGLLMVVGGVCEKSHSIPQHAFFEEFFELWGYVFILLSSITANGDITRRNS